MAPRHHPRTRPALPYVSAIPETCPSGEDISLVLCGFHGWAGERARRPPGRRQEAGRQREAARRGPSGPLLIL